MAFKPIDPKRDEFRHYLERSGVIEALTKVFVRIVKERPENPLEYLRHNLGDSLHQADNVAYLQSELEEARCEIQRLRDIIESVNPEALEEHQREEVEGAVADEPTALESKEKRNGSEGTALETDMANGTAPTSTVEPRTIPAEVEQQEDLNGVDALDNGINKVHISAETTPPIPTQAADNSS